jgi:hypothetical protein
MNLFGFAFLSILFCFLAALGIARVWYWCVGLPVELGVALCFVGLVCVFPSRTPIQLPGKITSKTALLANTIGQ